MDMAEDIKEGIETQDGAEPDGGESKPAYSELYDMEIPDDLTIDEKHAKKTGKFIINKKLLGDWQVVGWDVDGEEIGHGSELDVSVLNMSSNLEEATIGVRLIPKGIAYEPDETGDLPKTVQVETDIVISSNYREQFSQLAKEQNEIIDRTIREALSLQKADLPWAMGIPVTNVRNVRQIKAAPFPYMNKEKWTHDTNEPLSPLYAQGMECLRRNQVLREGQKTQLHRRGQPVALRSW
jgi:hypothetical protein